MATAKTTSTKTTTAKKTPANNTTTKEVTETIKTLQEQVTALTTQVLGLQSELWKANNQTKVLTTKLGDLSGFVNDLSRRVARKLGRADRESAWPTFGDV